MSTEFTAQSVIELTPHAAESPLVQSILTRAEDDPLRSFEDVHAELDGSTLWLDVYGTSFNCYDQLRAVLSRLARRAGQPFAVTGTAEGEGFTWYFGQSRRETTAFEITSKASAVAHQLLELRERMKRNTDPEFPALRGALRKCAQLLQRAVRSVGDTNARKHNARKKGAGLRRSAHPAGLR
jgi:hypothetical protein